MTATKVMPLWKLTTWSKKFRKVEASKQADANEAFRSVTKDFIKSFGKSQWTIKFITAENKKSLYANVSELKDCEYYKWEIIAISEAWESRLQYYNWSFMPGWVNFATSKDTNLLNNKYLYYYLLNRENDVNKCYETKNSVTRHVNMNKLLNMNIKVPTLKIQNKIVEVCNKLSKAEIKKLNFNKLINE